MTKTSFCTQQLAITTGFMLAAAILLYALPANAQLESRADQRVENRTEVRTTDSAIKESDQDKEVEQTNYNNSRSNRANVAPDTDTDGRADVSRQPDYNDEDNDGDGVSAASDDDPCGPGVWARGGDRNESCPERTRDLRTDHAPAAVDAVENANNATATEQVRSRTGITREIDKASPHIQRLRGIDKSSPLLYERIRTGGLLCPEADCDDADEDVRPGAQERRQHALRIQVSGDEVRGASDEAKAEVRQRLQAINEINDSNDFGIRVALAAIDNESVTDITTDDEQTTIRYRVPARILGLFRTNLQARVEATSAGERVRYPWYAFLASKEDQPTLRQLAAELRANHDAILSAAVEENEE